MKLIVLTNDVLKTELLACPVSEQVEWSWLSEPIAPAPGVQAEACIDLLYENNPERNGWLKSLGCPVIIVNSVITTLEEIGEKKFVRINGWNSFLERPLVEAAGTEKNIRENTDLIFRMLGRTVEWVPDVCGFVTPRIVSTIINEAFFSLEEKISTEKEIDTAMKMGTNYPNGPFEWAAKIGLKNVYALLDTLASKQQRYSVSPLLTQLALA